MGILKGVMRAFKREPLTRYDESSHILDHVPISSGHEWRRQRLVEAAQKHGKPFKCAGENMPREVWVHGKALVVEEQHASASPKVTALPTRQRARAPA
jgi:hypothetical protein